MPDEDQISQSEAEEANETDQLLVITDSATDRYQTFGFISWWRQEVVRSATVMVIGAGALGNEVIKNLALMGIGRILIVDFDTIEDANLSRSILFRTGDRGRKKAEVAAEAVKNINPDVQVKWLHVDANWQLGLGLFRRADAIIGCLDNRVARLSINKACWKVGKPWLDAAIGDLHGEARVFWAGRGACYECLLTDDDWKRISLRNSCVGLARANVQQGKIPTTPTISSIMAGVQTQDAMKLLNGMEVRPGTAFVFSGYDNSGYVVEYPVKPECQDRCQYNQVRGPVVEWPEGRAASTTASDVLAFADERWGSGCLLELDWEFVTGLVNRDRSVQIEVFRPFYEMSEADAVHPVTGVLLIPESTHTIQGNEVYAQWPLGGLGIPPLHVLHVRRGEEDFYVELTGDEAELRYR